MPLTKQGMVLTIVQGLGRCGHQVCFRCW
jgi:hypothetical protein